MRLGVFLLTPSVGWRESAHTPNGRIAPFDTSFQIVIVEMCSFSPRKNTERTFTNRYPSPSLWPGTLRSRPQFLGGQQDFDWGTDLRDSPRSCCSNGVNPQQNKTNRGKWACVKHFLSWRSPPFSVSRLAGTPTSNAAQPAHLWAAGLRCLQITIRWLAQPSGQQRASFATTLPTPAKVITRPQMCGGTGRACAVAFRLGGICSRKS